MKENKRWEEMTPQEKKKAKFNLSLLAIIALIVASIMAAGIFNDSTEPQKKEESVAVVHNDELDGSVRQITQFLKKNLNDPGSYESVEWGPVTENPHTKWFVVRHKYRAKNGYGATQIYNQIFTLDSLGTVLSTSDVE
ncbi:hypothetical protein [Segatella oulorum]|jgi:hypothetical protein|uniref:hypothetical protein n=1 Tax=Segatella oulorum TaxID=28136 RepID=UPI003613829C